MEPEERRFHDVAGIFPMMSRHELEQLAADIKGNGQREPIYTHGGLIIDGRNRFLACRLAGVEPQFERWDGKGSLVDFVVSLNLRRRHLDESQRAMVAAKIATLHDGVRSDRQGASKEAPTQPEAAEMLNVSRASVQRAKTVIEHGAPELRAAVEAGVVAVAAAADVAKLSHAEQRQLIVRLDPSIVRQAAKDIRRQQTREAFHSNESVQWYSPAEPIELARALMGGIDLDPASTPEANEVVRADRIFTVDDDGLAQPWGDGVKPCRVWLNWPGGFDENEQSNATKWCGKLLEEHPARATEAVVMLFNAATDRQWFHPLWDFPLCFFYSRQRFRRPGGAVGNQPLQPSALAYLGPNVGRFRELFEPLGRIVVPARHLLTIALPISLAEAPAVPASPSEETAPHVAAPEPEEAST